MQALVEVRRPSPGIALLDLEGAFAEFLRIDVANGDASPDTLRGYRTQAAQWVDWCRSRGIEPAGATTRDVKAYRQQLVARGFKPATVAHKLVVVRLLYHAAVSAGLRPDHPAEGVRPPREKRPAEDFGYLNEGELALLFRSVPKDDTVKSLRDRSILAVLGLQGLRTVEIERANVGDLRISSDTPSLLVRGKGRDRIVYLRPDVAELLARYLHVRGPVEPDGTGEPLLVAVGNYAGGGRISRRGIRKTVDHYLRKADLKRAGLSDHALRHTAATLAYRHTRDLRAVQEMLGHADPKTTARYARVIDMAKRNPALAVPIRL